MTHRIASTVILWLAFIAILVVGGVHGAYIILTAAALLTQWEAYGLIRKTGGQPQAWAGIAAGALYLLGFAYFPYLGLHPLAGLALGFTLLVLFVLVRGPASECLSAFSATSAGLAVPLMLGFFVPIIQSGQIMLAVWVIAAAKFTDVGALLVGLKFGRTSFSPVLSPNKTWEGVIGGILVSAVVSLLFQLSFSQYLPVGFSPLFALWAAVPVAIAAITADLFESALKRSAGVKDSGRTIPGIGGVFDLTDSFLLATPVGFLLLSGLLAGL
ncbi:MAG: phosphatidate cytidylyltransferase [Opitutales bacterium]|nr:phosphatidate cytidylyltransferase [Opitutales bacterium]